MIMQEKEKSKSVRKGYDNDMEISFDAISYNEAFSRMVAAAFIAPLNPTMEELSDVKTAVSEAVTNAVIHGYENVCGYMPGRMKCPREISNGKIHMRCSIRQDVLTVEIADHGKGIPDIEKAMEPLFTTKPELDRSGMGFAFMEAFMDDISVESQVGLGTKVIMTKKIGSAPWVDED